MKHFISGPKLRPQRFTSIRLLAACSLVLALGCTSATAMPEISIRTKSVKSAEDVDPRLLRKKPELSSVQPTTQVYQGKDLLLELRNNRFIRFRGTPQNDLWIASEHAPMDLAWSYQDVNDFDIQSINARKTPQGFLIDIEADKPSVDGKVKLSIEARWNSGTKMFEYMLTSTMDANLEAWWNVSRWAKSGAYTSRRPGASLDAFDYHINRISITDLLQNNYKPEDILYDAFVRSKDGKTWEKWPKLHVSFTTRPGTNYIALNALGNYQIDDAGEYFGFLDGNEGGWLTQLLEMPETPGSSVSFMLCWFYQDVHFLMRNAVPPKGTSERFTLRYKVHFVPQPPARAQEILATATELPWREQGEYQLPVFSMNNRFDKLISGSRETQWPWFASSWDCVWDDSVGYDDNTSVRITSTTPGPKAWYVANLWGYPRDQHHIAGKRFRMSAMVKTSDLKGRARIAVIADSKGDAWIHHPSHNGKRFDTWTTSEWISGDNDWQKLTVEFKVAGDPALVLEQEGEGTTWFDNVVIEEIR